MGDFGQKKIKIRVAKNTEKAYNIYLKVKSALSVVLPVKQGLKLALESSLLTKRGTFQWFFQ